MAIERDLLTGIAVMIADNGIGKFNPSGVYAATDTGIIFKNMPAAPDRVITLTAVPMTDMTTIPVGMMLVQVKMRGLPNDPLDVDDLGSAIFDLIQTMTNVTMGTTHVIQCLRNSSVPMGVDSANRWLRTDHYYVDLDYPGTTNRPEYA